MATDSDHPPPIPLLGNTHARKAAKGVSQTLDDLTRPQGPLYQIVTEVKKSNDLSVRSNALAVSNQRRLSLTQVGLVLCLCGIALVTWYINKTAEKLHVLQTQQAQQVEVTKSFVELMQETNDKIETAQESIDSAPKIVSDDKGGLKVVATVEPSKAAPPAKPKAASKKSASKGSANAANWGDVQEMLDDGADDRAEKKAAAPAKAEQVEIPLQVQKAQMK